MTNRILHGDTAGRTAALCVPGGLFLAKWWRRWPQWAREQWAVCLLPRCSWARVLARIFGLGLHELSGAERSADRRLRGCGNGQHALGNHPVAAAGDDHDHRDLAGLLADAAADAGCVVSILVARRLHPESIYTEPLRRKGLTVSQETIASEAATERTVGDFMHAPVPPVRESATLREIAERFLTSANNFLPVVDARNRLLGIVALHDLKEYLGSGEQVLGVIAYDLMRPPPACVTPNQRLLEILPVVLASEIRNIPVVNTLRENRLVGALSRAEVLNIFSEVIAASGKGEG